MSLFDHSRLIALRTSAVVQEFAACLEGGHNDAELAAVEKAIDQLMTAYSDVWSLVAPGGRWAADVREQYEPLLRTLASGVSLFQVLAQVACQAAGFPWGAHLFSAAQLRAVQFEPLPEQLPSSGLTRLIPDLAADLINAIDTLTDAIPDSGLGIKNEIVRALQKICAGCGCTIDHTARLSDDWGLGALLTPEEAGRQLEVSLDEVVRRIETRELVGVPLWSGTWGVPAFQFVRDQLHPHVKHVLEHAHDRLRGWPLALWLAVAIRDRRPEPWYRQVLGNRGLWKPHWSDPETGEFADVDVNRQTVDVNGDLYRISTTEFGPFYFSSVQSIAGGRVTPPAGRFDLDSGLTDKGTMYTAVSAEGACNEVLDREPVLTLSQVLDRTMWRLEPREAFEVVDLTDLSANLAATTNRRDTQSLALRMSQRSKGLQVGLRTSGTQVGVALFGSAGGHLPSSVGLGLWATESDPLLRTESLWGYVEARERDQPGFPVLLRQFPDESLVRGAASGP